MISFDWNWFFSSFSQSAAALIGIIGAFIISRLLGLSEKINSTISHFDNLVIEFNRIKTSLSNRHFYWYVKTQVEHNDDLKEAIKKGEFKNLNRDESIKKIYKMDNRLYKVDKAVMEGYNNLNNKSQTAYSFIPIIPKNLWENLAEENEAINNLKVEALTLIQHFHQNLQTLNSFIGTVKPLKVIIVLLMLSFPLTVIYPLHFMPVILNQEPIIIYNPLEIFKSIFSLKFIMLSIFFFSIEGLFYYFYLQTKQLETMLTLAIKSNSDDYKKIENYSPHLQEN